MNKEKAPDTIELLNCPSCRLLPKDEEKYRTSLIAYRGSWRGNAAFDHGLPSTPEVGMVYPVVLNGPLRIVTRHPIWIFYDPPFTDYNNAKEIELSRFCLGNIEQLLETKPDKIAVDFRVIKLLSFKEILENFPVRSFPKMWVPHFVGFVKCDLDFFDPYYLLSVTLEGDVGQNCIIDAGGDKPYICFMNEWTHHEDFIFGGKYEVPKEIGELLNLPT